MAQPLLFRLQGPFHPQRGFAPLIPNAQPPLVADNPTTIAVIAAGVVFTAQFVSVTRAVAVVAAAIIYAAQVLVVNAKRAVAVIAAAVAYSASIAVFADVVVHIAFIGIACTAGFLGVMNGPSTTCRWPFRFAYHLGIHRSRRQ